MVECLSIGGNEASASRPLHSIVLQSALARLLRALRCRQTGRPAHFFIVTNVIRFTRLLASKKLPSRVTDVLRTMFPPPGIAQLWNFSVLGSKRTTVFAVDPDSLYQMIPLIAEMP